MALGVGVGGWGWGGWLGGTPTHVHMHTHAHMCMHAHTHMVNMIISCKWPPQLGESLGIPYDYVICAYTCMCVHAYAHVWGTPYPPSNTPPHPIHTPPTPIHPPPTPRGDPRNHSKFNSTWTNQDISIPFEDLKSVETSPPMGGCMVWCLGGWVGGWVDGWDQVKTLKI